jgi:hypothetical protein
VALLQVVVPLLLVHGWPGSVLEFLDIIPLLTGAAGPVALEAGSTPHSSDY